MIIKVDGTDITFSVPGEGGARVGDILTVTNMFIITSVEEDNLVAKALGTGVNGFHLDDVLAREFGVENLFENDQS